MSLHSRPGIYRAVPRSSTLGSDRALRTSENAHYGQLVNKGKEKGRSAWAPGPLRGGYPFGLRRRSPPSLSLHPTLLGHRRPDRDGPSSCEPAGVVLPVVVDKELPRPFEVSNPSKPESAEFALAGLGAGKSKVSPPSALVGGTARPQAGPVGQVAICGLVVERKCLVVDVVTTPHVAHDGAVRPPMYEEHVNIVGVGMGVVSQDHVNVS